LSARWISLGVASTLPNLNESIKIYCPPVGPVTDGDPILQAVYDPNVNARGK
jgi:hypothetical protein